MRKKFVINLLAVLAVLMVGDFRAFGLDVVHGPLAVLAAATANYATQTKILMVVAGVYGLLQGIKKFIPIAGIGSVIFNIAFSVLGVVTVVQPQDLFSTQTLTLILIAAAGAAGVHGTVRSFSGNDSSSSGGGGVKIATLAFAVFALAMPMHAQTAIPSPTPSPESNVGVHFDVSTSFVKLTAGGDATLISARLPLTPRWSFQYDQYQVPTAKAQFFLGGAEFREKLAHLVKTKSLLFNPDAIEIYAGAGIGTKRDDLLQNPLFAFGVHGGADIKIGQVGGGTLTAGVAFGYISAPAGNTGPVHFSFASSPEIAPKLAIRF